MARNAVMTSADCAQIARNGVWLFVLLMLFGGVLTTVQYHRAYKSAMISQPELVFSIGPMLSGIEQGFYNQYFSALELSDISAKSIHFTKDGLVKVAAGVPLEGPDDPRVRHIVEGLPAVKQRAIAEMKSIRAATGSEAHLLELFLARLREGSDQPSKNALVIYAERRLDEMIRRDAFYDTRIADPTMPTLVRVSDAKVRTDLIVGIFVCAAATLLTALAGGFVFGYGRLIAKRSATG